MTTWNPLDKGANITLSSGDLVASNLAGGGGFATVRATVGKTTGKWYWEVTVTTFNSLIGICTASGTLASYNGSDTHGFGLFNSNGNRYYNGSATAYISPLFTGDIVGVLLNLDNMELSFKINNGTATTVIDISAISGTIYPSVSPQSSTGVATARFDSGATTYSPPSGYSTLDTGGAYSLTVDQGSFSLTGQTSSLLFNRNLVADQGAFALTGQEATLQKDTPGAFTLQVDAGSYSWTGQDALADYAMNADVGSYALTGQEVTFSIGVPQAYTLSVDPGYYSYSGIAARLDWSGAPIIPSKQTGIYMGMRIGL